ncbi:hypothetical protein Tco_1549036 [Tanacetum coccineum]
MEIVFLLNVDQSILCGVSADVDTAYSSKSGNGLYLVKVLENNLEYGILPSSGYGILDLDSFVVFSEVQAQIRRIFFDGYDEEAEETMAENMEQYMSKTRASYRSGVARPKIEDKDNFELKGQFLKELRTNTFSGSDHEDANEHIEKVLEIVNLFHIPNITIDQVMLRAFPISLTGAASHWLRNKPSGSIITWEDLKTAFLSKYYPPARTAKKMEEINNFQQELDENLYQA